MWSEGHTSEASANFWNQLQIQTKVKIHLINQVVIAFI